VENNPQAVQTSSGESEGLRPYPTVARALNAYCDKNMEHRARARKTFALRVDDAVHTAVLTVRDDLPRGPQKPKTLDLAIMVISVFLILYRDFKDFGIVGAVLSLAHLPFTVRQDRLRICRLRGAAAFLSEQQDPQAATMLLALRKWSPEPEKLEQLAAHLLPRVSEKDVRGMSRAEWAATVEALSSDDGQVRNAVAQFITQHGNRTALRYLRRAVRRRPRNSGEMMGIAEAQSLIPLLREGRETAERERPAARM